MILPALSRKSLYLPEKNIFPLFQYDIEKIKLESFYRKTVADWKLIMRRL